ncbi:LacI family DNA-binding transcriptional regulator [Nocardioides sp. zg-579]|uniref:LacI family DNA-binding transcriptional regulator n=1 Tax=Nocardioides marmotae TaxID=2663857 RepID=A0A6I3JC42_9ACTN|nr:LacI family DNA-binding transcriptional regulator [Nocardioides marmotae]MCR6032050.1 LacI family DNA-binding transcriptional regulator [Gordonia jinghuaiqii]MTB95694.1 LacI family DNA-binding transcriptional regulator [Nocardioides marmotae]QKE01099.1 LacI family DNA-binding transcriptional regulator [Nocardioides marmotae]
MASGVPSERRRSTLADVAAGAGVSLMTASYAYSRPGRVSERARGRVLAAAAELGYPGPDPRARSLRRGTTLTLGVVLGEYLTYAFDDPGAVAFMAGIAEVCADRGYGMTILPLTGAAEDARRITDAAVDGFVVWTTSEDDPALAAIRATRRPAVVHGGPAGAGATVVTIDDRAAARAVGALAFAGARRPAVVSQPLDRDRRSHVGRGIDVDSVAFPVTRARLAGYREAAEESGVDWNDVLVAVCSRNDATEAEQITRGLLGSARPPDAIAAMSDQMAAGVVRAARAAGRAVPDDLAVTGWDDLPVAAELGLTTVAQSLRDQGAACARVALGQEPPATVPWSVVPRATTTKRVASRPPA